MQTVLNTAATIENLVDVTLGADASEREKYMLRQSLLNLVRMARVEYKMEMQASVDKLLHVLPDRATLVV
ncbi:hypothetical protein [Noviherbaspirillum aerium]|uniref:hypothetical protein n=1 Tax=Noviherbaspirillum aerium TaxID=2588497 RepID=UPI00124D69F1|nr:hypothetical protein [Noviherbaspirillum aerium]